MAKSNNSTKANKNHTSNKAVCTRCGRDNQRPARPNCKNVSACFQRFMEQ